MVSDCGLSRKTNKKTNSIFLYFRYYKDGKKIEKYLGRADDAKANLKGSQEMLKFYRNQDEELHQMIKKLEIQISNNSVNNSKVSMTHNPIIRIRPDYIPDFED